MNRRQFFRFSSSAAVAPLAPSLTAPALESPKPRTDLQRMVEIAKPMEWVDFMGRRICWIGWKQSQHIIEMIGQWLCDMPEYRATLYISVPGYWGILRNGEAFLLDYRPSDFFARDLAVAPNPQEVLRTAQCLTGALLLSYLCDPAVLKVRVLGQWSPFQVEWDDKRLRDWRLKFYVDPYGWVLREYGVDPTHASQEDRAYQLLELTRRRLYGLKESA